MDQTMLLRLWDESWSEGIWVAAWAKAMEELTPEQAAWQQAPGRHSIWQIVNHVCIWREYTLKKIDPTRPGPAWDAKEDRNFEPPMAVTPEAWEATVSRLKRSHDEMRAVIAAGWEAAGEHRDRPWFHLGHDCYHLGQIMYLRAMQGLAVIE